MKKVLLVCLCNVVGLTYAQQTKPNIIVILADDMGYSDIGCMGGEVKTPNLDALAEKGVLFSNFYNASVSCPSRSALLTGQYQWDAGMGAMCGNRHDLSSYQGCLNQQCMTIAEVMQYNGYQTFMSGKWHVGDARECWPDRRGFDEFYGIPNGGGVYFYPPKYYERKIYENGEEIVPDTSWYSTDAFTDAAIRYIEKKENNRKPFFMYLAYIAPHYPLQAKEKDVQKYLKQYEVGYDVIRKNRIARQKQLGIIEDENTVSTPVYLDWEKVKNKKDEIRKMAVYAAMIDCMDQNIGRLVETLKKKNLYENTVILFMSDNGGSMTDFNKTPDVEIGNRESNATYGIWYNVSNTPNRLGKTVVYEGGIKTPLIVHWPSKIKNHIHNPLAELN